MSEHYCDPDVNALAFEDLRQRSERLESSVSFLLHATAPVLIGRRVRVSGLRGTIAYISGPALGIRFDDPKRPIEEFHMNELGWSEND